MTAIVAALITGGLSFLGVLVTNIFSNKKVQTDIKIQAAVTAEKIDELKSQVEKHNGVIERTYELEAKAKVQEEQIKVINHRLKDLEQEK